MEETIGERTAESVESVFLEAFAFRYFLVYWVARDVRGDRSVEGGVEVRDGDGFGHLLYTSMNYGERRSIVSVSSGLTLRRERRESRKLTEARDPRGVRSPRRTLCR